MDTNLTSWILPVIALAAIFLGTGCAGGVRQVGALQVRERTIERWDDGSLRTVLLAEPAEIDGIPCARWARFFRGGRLEDAELSRDCTLNGQPLPAGSRVFFTEAGVLESTFLSENTLLDGVPCDGGPMKCQTTFHPNGRVRMTFLHEDAEIQGVSCEGSVFASVRFDDQGRLVGCKLSRAATIDGVSFPSGAKIERDEHGRMRVLD